MAETYSAGIVTAYGAAVRGGYTGTYDEFCTEQAGFAENAQQVAEDKAATEQLVSDFGTVTVPAAEQQIAAAGAAQVAAVNAAGQDKETDIAAAGAAQVTRVETTGTQTVGSVETAGSQQVAAVNAAGAAQVAAVAAEGTTQTGAVQAKGQEILDSIPEDYTALVDEVAANKAAFDADLAAAVWSPNITRGSYIKVLDGTVASSNKYARTALWNGYGQRKAVIVDNPVYEFCLALYDETGNLDGTGYLRSTGYATGMQYIPQDAAMLGVSFRRVDQAVLTADDSTAISAALSALAATDTSLAIAGKAADAKAVGDADIKLDKKIADVAEAVTDSDVSWELGAINASTGGDITSSSTIRLIGYYKITDLVDIQIAEGAKVGIRLYGADYNFKLYGNAYYQSSFNLVDRIAASNVAASAVYFRLVCQYVDGSSVTDVDDLAARVTVQRAKVLALGRTTPKVMMFGDSITRGINSDTGSQVYSEVNLPNLLTSELGFEFANYGIGSIGWLETGSATKGKAIEYLQRVGNADWYWDGTGDYVANKFIGRPHPYSYYNTIILAFGANDRAINSSATPLGGIGSYSSTKSYAVGDYAVKSHAVWRCTTAISREAWNAEHWERVPDNEAADIIIDYTVDDSLTYEEEMALAPISVFGAVYQCYRYLAENAPDARIIIVDPILQVNRNKTAPAWGLPTAYDSSDRAWTWYQYYATMEAFCRRYGLGHISTLDAPINRMTPWLQLKDNVHPTTACYHQLSRYYAGKISALVL